MSGFKKDEESGMGSFFQDKTTVIQEARVFNETPISPRKCRILLTKIVYLLYVGETFGTQEATTLFFGVTKLFQHKDSALRQMVYLVIKELSNIAEDVIMVTSSIMKDMQPNLEVIYRPNAIRALCRVIDGSMIVGVERFFKAAIVDRNTSISSAALVSSYHLHPVARDVIKRWANEAAEAVQNKNAGYQASYGGQGYSAPGSSSSIVQYHALGLLYLIRQGDRMAVTKMIQQLSGAKGSGGTLRSPYAICMLIRFAAKVMEEDPNVQRGMYELIEGYLKHKSDMVNYEAARAICDMKNVGAQELQRPIAVLQLFLSSPKATLKFAAIRTLAKLAQTHPNAVQVCNLDMEKLINDDNRSVATFAITTLLKTGNEASVDRLMKQISAFMSEISDEFKVIVVSAIRALCLKFPAKQSVMLNFLSGVLRDEGGYDFKRAVVEAIFDMIKFISDSKEAALAQLCEFIEDCEFTKLSVRILHLIGIEGPKAPQPSKYIRYIYNRVILENAIVRAAAVSSLAKFGINVADVSVKKSIKVLLTRCLDDVDDEVRDRAAFNLKLLQDEPLANTFVRDDSTFSLDALEARLASYVADQEAAEQPFDFTAVPKVSKEQALETARRSRKDLVDSVAVASDASGVAGSSGGAPSASETQSAYATQLSEVPEFASYGQVLKSSLKPVELTERETEYVVSAVKHIFSEHVVFQFNVRNTVDAVHLENVVVVMQAAEEDGDLTEDFIIPLSSLGPNSDGVVYVSFSRTDPSSYATGSFGNTLKFLSKEVDPESGEPEEDGYDDEYQLEEVDVGAGDYIVPSYAAFATEWDRLRTGATGTETFALTALDSLKTACDSILDILGMEALGGTESPASSTVHTLNMSGLVAGGGGKVLARARMTFQSGQGVTMELSVRAEQEAAAQLVLNAIA
ncbi:hypothetical protein JCM11251_000682 [Rhodosporidiobolus azoricus]